MIGQGLVATGQALRRVVLRFLPAERPLSQPLHELEAEEGILVGRSSSRARRCRGPLHPSVQDCPIGPARDHGPLGGGRVLDGIRRVPALTVRMPSVRIADWLRRARVGPGLPALRVGAHRAVGFHEGHGEDQEAEGRSPPAGRSEVSDVHGLDLRREEPVIRREVTTRSHAVRRTRQGT